MQSRRHLLFTVRTRHLVAVFEFFRWRSTSTPGTSFAVLPLVFVRFPIGLQELILSARLVFMPR
jgi:hypothetical protein